MPTPAERKALFFLSGLMLLGSGVRASAALSGAEREPGVGAEQPALERQIEAVDTARARSSSKKSSSRKKSKKTSASATRSATRTVSSSTGGTVTSGSRLSDMMAVSASGGDVRTTVYYTSTKPGKIDVDVADAAALEALPRIGPVMAKRIVADRDSLGPFGSLKELQRVKGVGPSLARALSPYVTFSLRPRPSRVKEPAGRPGPERARRRPPSHL
ncbi:MAG TPA: helix-hairpin-helix domain-containing protein [Gemmatimonadaceae bacterium]|nr:helix-hairpin-helix domain-containing protein [Gemmatimonadaceae bacterium]